MRKAVIVALIVIAVGYLLTGVMFVRPGERAVIRRFGRVLEDKPRPGLWVGLPWGMDQVDRIEVNKVKRVKVGYVQGSDGDDAFQLPGQVLTGDHNLMNVTVLLDYAVLEDDNEVERYAMQRDRVEPLMTRATEAVLAEWLGSRAIDEILVSGKTNLPPVLIAQVQEKLRPYDLGIKITSANVPHLAAPDAVKHAFDAVTRAHANMETATNKAHSEAQLKMNKARSDAYQTEQLAQAYSNTQQGLAAADAEAFNKRLAVYNQMRKDNPNYLSSIWWDEIGKLFAQLQKNGQIDLLDRHLSADGLDITVMPRLPKK